MERSTVITLLIVAGLGGLVLWWYLRQPDASVMTQSPQGTCGSGVMGSIGNFINGHVDRKNTFAPLVASAYTKAPAGQLAGVTNIAGQISPSNYVEKKLGKAVGDWFCNVSLPSISNIKNAILNHPVTRTSASVGTSQLKAGTVGPVKSLASAGNNLVHGNFGAAATDAAKSVYEGPKSAVTTTYNAIKSINPF